MTSDLFHFEWWVDQRGYELTAPLRVESESAAARLLLDGAQYVVRLGGAESLTAYQPAQTAPRLHREFAESVIDAQSAFAFVSKYGYMGSFMGRADAEREGVDGILSAAKAIRHLIGELDAQPIFSAAVPRRRVRSPKLRKIGAAAYRRLAPSLTRESKQPLGDYFNRHVSPHMTVRIDVSNPKNQAIQIVPRSLISWMWLRVAEEVTGEKVWRRCINEACPAPYFQVNLKDGRIKKRKFCDLAACRQADKRKRDNPKAAEAKGKGKP